MPNKSIDRAKRDCDLDLLERCLNVKGIADSIISKDGKEYWIRALALGHRYVEGSGPTLGEAIQKFAKQLL
jgi:hypothetical protein